MAQATLGGGCQNGFKLWVQPTSERSTSTDKGIEERDDNGYLYGSMAWNCTKPYSCHEHNCLLNGQYPPRVSRFFPIMQLFKPGGNALRIFPHFCAFSAFLAFLGKMRIFRIFLRISAFYPQIGRVMSWDHKVSPQANMWQ